MICEKFGIYIKNSLCIQIVKVGTQLYKITECWLNKFYVYTELGLKFIYTFLRTIRNIHAER